MLLQKILAAVDEKRVPAFDGERVLRARKRPKTIYGTVK